MNFKAELIKRVTADIERLVAHGKTRDEAIDIVRSESMAGPAVWAEVLKNV